MSSVKKSNLTLVILFIITFIGAIVACYYRYYYYKEYQYLVEAFCDPMLENCFVRDCSNPDDCPPNQLSIYKEFYVPASDFGHCIDNSCKQECESGSIQCTEVSCDEENGDTCSISPYM